MAVQASTKEGAASIRGGVLGAHRQVGQVHDLTRLPSDLALLLGVSVLEEFVDVRDDVEGELVREDRVLDLLALNELGSALCGEGRGLEGGGAARGRGGEHRAAPGGVEEHKAGRKQAQGVCAEGLRCGKSAEELRAVCTSSSSFMPGAPAPLAAW